MEVMADGDQSQGAGGNHSIATSTDTRPTCYVAWVDPSNYVGYRYESRPGNAPQTVREHRK